MDNQEAELDAKIASFVGLGEDWDSHGGKPVSPEFAPVAQAFARWLPSPDSVVPLSNGGVGFRWTEHDIDIDLAPNGEIEGIAPPDGFAILAALPREPREGWQDEVGALNTALETLLGQLISAKTQLERGTPRVPVIKALDESMALIRASLSRTGEG